MQKPKQRKPNMLTEQAFGLSNRYVKWTGWKRSSGKICLMSKIKRIFHARTHTCSNFFCHESATRSRKKSKVCVERLLQSKRKNNAQLSVQAFQENATWTFCTGPAKHLHRQVICYGIAWNVCVFCWVGFVRRSAYCGYVWHRLSPQIHKFMAFKACLSCCKLCQ